MKCMVEAIAQSRIVIADSTQTRRDGREYEYKTEDFVDVHRKPEGIHAKDGPGWLGPPVICDLSPLPDGTIGVKWSGSILHSVNMIMQQSFEVQLKHPVPT